MGKQKIFLSLFLGCALLVGAQETHFDIKPNAFLARIVKNRQKIKGNIYWGTAIHNLLPFKSKQISKSIQNLIVSDSAVFITVDGTGLVYQLTPHDTPNLLTFQRVDSTIYAGNTFQSLNFCFNNQLYSLGGYGFWRCNGQLRSFTPITQDWNIKPLNKELTVRCNDVLVNLWYDPFNQSIFSLGYSNLNQATPIYDNELNLKLDSVYVLDLNVKTWHSLGAIRPAFQKNINEASPIINTRYGLLVTNNSKIDFEIWNLHNNTVQKLSKEIQHQFPISGLDEYCFWNEDSIVFFANRNNNKIDSVIINASHLIDTGQHIYSTPNSIVYNTNLLAGILIFILVIILVIAGFKNREIVSFKKPTKEPLKSATDSKNIYSEIEKALINLLISNTNNGRLTSIDEVNYVLGMQNKSVNMQKRTRSDVINTINSKFQLSQQTTASLILRKNSELDQRVKEFYISSEHIELLSKI